MNRILSVFIPAIILFGYIYQLGSPIETSGGTLPPLGKFFNPFTGFWKNAENTNPRKEQAINLEGLSEPATVMLDERLVPHIFAGNEQDLVMIQGYLHAKYRLWQMDITSRQAAGRLVEIFGENLLANDQRMRRMGLARTAEKFADRWQQCDEYALLKKYVDGINQYITQLQPAEYPFEFKLFGYKPEKWSIEKTAQVVLSMNLMLCGRNEDLMASNTLALIGEERFKELFPRWNPKQSPIIPKEIKWEFQTKKPAGEIKSLGFFPGELINDYPPSIGSNNWAVSGEKTMEGHPILCNDPHLSLTLPSIWYELQMCTQEFNAYGVSLPGIPYIAIGFNDHVAWGETNVGMDVSDLYEIEWTDSAEQKYMLDGQMKSIQTDIEEFIIKGTDPVYDTIKLTDWGPVFIEEGRSLALKWLPNLATDNCIVGSFRQLNQANNFDEYYNALRLFKSPAQNFAFASQSGDIALKVQGDLPIKPENEGQFIMPGNTSSNNWSGYIPFDETPFVKNPSRGFVSSANQNSTDTTYPYKYHGYFDDYRGRTLNEALSAMNEITVEKMQDLQNSTYSKLAAELTPLLINSIAQKEGDNKWIGMLGSWNYYYDKDAQSPIIFEIWKDEFYRLLWDEFYTYQDESQLEIIFPEIWKTIDLIESDPEHPYFDIVGTEEKENADDVIRQSFENATEEIDSLFSSDSELTWKKYRTVKINHLSRIPAFSEIGIDVGGIASALNSVKETHGPSWRMVVQLSDPVEAWGIYPGGQSGNPGSPYYKNMIKDWAAGNYYKLDHPHRAAEMSDKALIKLNILP